MTPSEYSRMFLGLISLRVHVPGMLVVAALYKLQPVGASWTYCTVMMTIEVVAYVSACGAVVQASVSWGQLASWTKCTVMMTIEVLQ